MPGGLLDFLLSLTGGQLAFGERLGFAWRGLWNLEMGLHLQVDNCNEYNIMFGMRQSRTTKTNTNENAGAEQI